jgi:purine-nucleoside phosphorylase
VSASYPTPHINARPEDFAKTVLMPGDPLRAKFVAENFLQDAVLVNNVRGIQGYTGYYDGVRVSVMASGMGIPSIGIYSYELFNFFGVENIIRIGSAGAIDLNIKVRDLVLGQGACTTSSYVNTFGLPGSFAPIASYELLKTAADISEELGVNYHVGNLLSSDAFYGDDNDLQESRRSSSLWGKMGVMAVEMEAAGLYMNAARAGKRALAICTVSDHIITGESLCAEDRQNTFTDMMKIALETAKRMEEK